MTDKEKEEISLHVAGATVRHSSPFDNIQVYRNPTDLDQEFINKYVVPYYMDIPITSDNKKGIEKFGQAKTDFTKDVVKKLLGDFNWRTRQTGAYFAAVNDFREFEETIGQLLVKSEVCYAGTVYSLSLATFNTRIGLEFLSKYSDHYLTTLDLFFDQRDVLTAIKYLDELNRTDKFGDYQPSWDRFIQNKPNWTKEITTDKLKKAIAGITEIKKYGR